MSIKSNLSYVVKLFVDYCKDIKMLRKNLKTNRDQKEISQISNSQTDHVSILINSLISGNRVSNEQELNEYFQNVIFKDGIKSKSKQEKPRTSFKTFLPMKTKAIT